MVLFMALGYGVCVVFLLGAGIAQRVSGRREVATGTFVWSVVVFALGVVFALRWLPTLAE